MRRLLVERAFPSWCMTADETFGGYRVGMSEADRSAHHLIATARLLWTFSHGLRHGLASGDRIEHAASLGFRCLAQSLHDRERGGFFWRVSSEGDGGDNGKYIYGQAFAIYGLVEYYRVTGEEEALALAMETFEVVMMHAHDPNHGGWIEHFDEAWRPTPKGVANPIELTGLRSGNAHLHWMEALTELYLVTNAIAVESALGEAMEINRRWFYPAPGWRATAWRTPDWKRVRPWKGRISYGHLVERAWLVLRAEHALGRESSWGELVRILDWVTRVAVDRRDGSLMAYGNVFGNIRDRTRIWWVQAEYLVALVAAVAHDLSTHRTANLDRLVDWLFEKQIDAIDGLWHGSIPAAGREVGQKHGPWKAGYHEVRAMATFVRAFGGEGNGRRVILER